ncbi:PBSX family phage terminase large subunit [Spirosoma horti]
MVRCSPIYKPLYSLPPAVRYIHLWGGRSRGGSFAATDYALFYLSQPDYFRGYLMRYIQGDIRVSLWRDMMDRIDEKEELGLLNRKDYKINTNEMSIVHLPTGNTLQSRGFKKSSGAQTAKMKSIAGATHIFLEEAEEVTRDDFNQLDDSLRTVKTDLRVFLIFNPPKKNHWIIEDYYTLRESRIPGYYIAHANVKDNFLSIFSTYHDNIKYVAKSTVEKFEGYRVSDPDWYWTVVRGLISEGAKGRIYRGWKAITNDEFASLPYGSYYALDFGFGVDPLGLSEVKRHNKRRYARELIYETGISDEELVRRLRAFRVGSRPIVADSAEPKSISFLRSKGFNVIAARKGADSIRFGIKAMQGCEWYYTQDSKNLAYEYQEYRWQLDANKETTTEPIGKHDHLLDGLRYTELTDPWGGGAIDHT